MTKQILILAYILTVLVISSLVRADNAIQAPIEHGIVREAEVNPMSGIMDVHGVLPTPCQMKPTVVVSQIDHNQNVVKFDVDTTNHGDVCVDMIYGTFDISFDLKELPLEANKTYSIVFNNFSGRQPDLKYTAVKVDGTFAPYRVNKESFNGTLMYYSHSIDGELPSGFALKKGNQTIPVVSPDMDLSRFQNHQVWMSGYAVDTAKMEGASGDDLAPSSQVQTVVVPVSVGALKP